MPSHRKPRGKKLALIFMGFLVLLPFIAVFLTVIAPSQGNGPASAAHQPSPAVSAPAVPHAHPLPAKPAPAPVAHKPAPHARTYVVKAGNTLFGIAVSQHVRGGWPALYHINHQAIGSNPNLIHAGLKLQL